MKEKYFEITYTGKADLSDDKFMDLLGVMGDVLDQRVGRFNWICTAENDYDIDNEVCRRWITDKLPKNNDVVLVTVEINTMRFVTFARYSVEAWHTLYGVRVGRADELENGAKVVAWMPNPEPYKRSEDKKNANYEE